MKDALKPEAARMIRESLEMTRGVRVTEVISVHAASSALSYMGMAQIKLIGWTPTLHAYEYTWQEDFSLELSAEHQCDEILLAVRSANSVNVLGEHEAGKIGIVDPIDHRAPNGIDHMRVDRSVVALLSRNSGDAKAQLSALVAQMVEMPDLDGMGNILDCDDGHAIGLRLMPYISLGENAVYDGMWLHTASIVPETLLDAVIGRKLRDVVDGLPAEIADRPIIKGENQIKGARFDVEPDFMAVGDI